MVATAPRAVPLPPQPSRAGRRADAEALIALIRRSVIGEDEAVAGPVGLRRVTYADYTASGRSLDLHRGLPARRGDAAVRQHAHRVERHGPADDALPRGRPTDRPRTRLAAAARARGDLLRQRQHRGRRQARRRAQPPPPGGPRRALRAVASTSRADSGRSCSSARSSTTPTSCPWRESIADVVTIHEDADGHVDLAQLEAELLRYADRPLRIGSFSAASNVTGILSDTRAISVLLHRHGALSFWDFAAAAPYVRWRCHLTGRPRTERDGRSRSTTRTRSSSRRTSSSADPGTPGVLVARRELFTNRVPVVVGGGTVQYVNPEEHVYLTDPEHREEGGTPAILESIRAGLVFQLKEQVGVEAIREREESLHRSRDRAMGGASRHRDPRQPARQAALDRLVRDPPSRPLPAPQLRRRAAQRPVRHPVARGCSCAGPYGHRLLGIDLDTSHEFEREIARGCEGIKPGWVRVNFNYFISEAVFDYLLRGGRDRGLGRLEAAAGVPRSTPETGLWRHAAGAAEPALSLDDVSYASRRHDATRRTGTASRSHAWPTTWRRRGTCLRGRRRADGCRRPGIRRGLRIAALVPVAD